MTTNNTQPTTHEPEQLKDKRIEISNKHFNPGYMVAEIRPEAHKALQEYAEWYHKSQPPTVQEEKKVWDEELNHWVPYAKVPPPIHNGEEETFESFVTNQRNKFARLAHLNNWWYDLPAERRVMIEDLLIAYDQMVDKLQSNADESELVKALELLMDAKDIYDLVNAQYVAKQALLSWEGKNKNL
jgi:hypothetical protein